mmetsp:Transcript_37567/g.73563  ORF Transcript_37567/g.73563 Transcript_37567/m.73563 type:complete len:109 (+) Transcript_37567:342-668(+)
MKNLSSLEITFDNYGLATFMTCKCMNERKICSNQLNHEFVVRPRTTSVQASKINVDSQYSLNLLSILCAHKSGSGYSDIKKMVSALGLKYMSIKSYFNGEKLVGQAQR